AEFLVRTTRLLEKLLALLWRVLQRGVEKLLHLLPQIHCHSSPLQRALQVSMDSNEPATGLVRQDSTLRMSLGGVMQSKSQACASGRRDSGRLRIPRTFISAATARKPRSVLLGGLVRCLP